MVFTLGLPWAVAAQEGTGRTAPVRSEHYAVLSDAGDEAIVLREMENRFAVYNRLFRFDPAGGAFPLMVRVFRDKTGYDNYISARLGGTRPGAVYLHYRQSGQRELVVNRGSPDENRTLPYQAFIQFLRSFVPYPPSWIREGFAIYFSGLTAGADGELNYTENLAWLEAVKNMEDRALAPEAILLADQRGFPPDFQSLSWAMVSFFLGSGREEYFRTITEIFLLLSNTAGAAENSASAMNRISRWNPPGDFSRDFKAYLSSRKTFTELIEDGQMAYAALDPGGAEMAFLSALDQRPNHYAPYYYLGLLAYEEGAFDRADEYYKSALQYGVDAALVYYALGVNAASAGKIPAAVNYLRQAAAASPERYGEKSESLIRRLR